MKKNILYPVLFSVLMLIVIQITGQVSINSDNSPADNSAILDVKSTTQGLLVPRMTQTQIEAITNPANGLIVFCTNDNKFYAYLQNLNQWKELTFGTATIPWTCNNPFTDSHDGKTYNTVLIGIQCWMAQNLNIGIRVNGSVDQTNNSIIEKYCFNDDENNCNTYGGLYQWDETMQYSTTPIALGICPTGWHLPTDNEWNDLTNYLGGESFSGGKLKEAGYTHWSLPNAWATNSTGFTALPGGARTNIGDFGSLTRMAYFWSSVQNGAPNAWARGLSYLESSVMPYQYNKIFGFSIRCIKD
jgi:uncharacterized protein (TIGR02145 family)